MTSMHRVSIGVFFIVAFVNFVFSQSCSSSTTCISLYDCPPVFNQIKQQQTITSNQAANLRRLACSSGPGRYPYICCPLASHKNGNSCTSAINISPFKWSGKCFTHNGVNVRLGEYDLTTTTDCIRNDCADPVMNVGVEEVVAHSGYNERNRNRTNDIGLVRLSEDVSYTDFVKPICLPLTVGASRSNAATSLQVAGWGRTLNSRQSNTKQKLDVPVFDHSACREKFATANTFIDDSQLCAGGTYIEDTCDGDSGGPLMKFSDKYWVVEGIVSFGRACGLEDWPGVYTRVSSFEDWIMSTMRP